MKNVKTSLRILLFFLAVFFSCKINAQVLGLGMGTSSTVNTPGNSFPVMVNFNLPPNTTIATATVTYESSKVSYVSTSLPGCFAVVNAGNQITITISNLAACPNTGSISLPLNFIFKCPDTCTGISKTAVFQGRAIHVNGDTLLASCTATGLLNSNVTLTHAFSAYSSAAAEVTFRISYNNLNCFKLKNPAFNIALSQGTIVGVYGTNYSYQFSGSVITRTDTLINSGQGDNIYYRVRIPCSTPANQVISSHVTLRGENCGTPNTVISNQTGLDPSYTTTSTPPAAITTIGFFQSHTSTQFAYRITNTGNTPMNLVITSRMPAIRVTQVQQNTDQPGIMNTVEYVDCSLNTTGPFNMNGTGVTNTSLPTNTRRVVHKIYNLEPGHLVWLFTTYNTSSFCSGTGGAPYRDTLNIQYNCVAPPVPCVPCGPGGVVDTILVHNPAPTIQCDSSTNMGNICKNVGDTVQLYYKLKNIGDGPLNAGTFTVPLPAGFSFVTGSDSYAGFTTNPTVANPALISFSLPTIPAGTSGYYIFFKARIDPGTAGNTYNFNSNITGAGPYSVNTCSSLLNVCLYAAIDIEKRVKGSDNTQYGITGSGTPGSLVNYELTLYNSGTLPVNNLIVVDRIPAPNNVRIGTGAIIPNAFPMQMQNTASTTNYTVEYTNTPNICTNWPSTAGNCNTGSWVSGLQQRGIRFTYTPAFEIAPGDSTKLYFQTMIPGTAGNNETDCNTAGFIASSNGTQLLYIESDSACITVQNPCPPAVSPNFTPAYSCQPNGYNVTVTSPAGSPAQHQWSLMQKNSCSGLPNDGTSVQVGATVTTQNALFIVPTGTTCYYIRHRVFVPGCYDTTARIQLTIPSASNSFVMQDINGNVKNSFCLGEEVIFNGTASTGETQYTVEIKRKPLAGNTFTPYTSFSYNGQAGTLNLSQLLLQQGLYFETQYQYSVVLTISNPANCIGPISTKGAFSIVCCEGIVNAGFQLNVVVAPTSYTINSVVFNTYALANPVNEWYVLSSPNQFGGPYTPVFSIAAPSLSWSGAQYNLYYTVIHKMVTSCGEVCASRSQWQSDSRSASEEIDACCLAAFYWANGPGNPPAPMSADFDISIASSGNAYYTINVSPTNTYSNLPGVTHEWYLWSSPNPFGGPYTPVSQGNYPNFAFNGATDALYYFIVHKVKTPCGEVCYTQDICRNCGEKKACDIKWPDCYPPVNLKNDCRRHALSWDPVSAAGAYEIELYYNDPECCKSEYLPSVKSYSFDGNVFDLDNYDHPKFNCIRWRVRAKCDKGYSEWSSWLCYYCGEVIGGPIFPLTEKSGGNKDAVKQQPVVTPQVLPNPNNGDMFLKMKTNGELIVSVNVFSSTGLLVKTIAESKYPDGNFVKSLNLGSGVAKGLYLIVFKTNFGTYTEKVIVK